MNVLDSQPILEKFDVDITLFTVWLLQPRPNKQIIYTVSSSMIKSTICLPSKADFVSPCSSRCLPITQYLCSLMRWCKCQVMCINTIKTITNLLHQSVCSVWLAQNNNLLEICCFNVKTSEVCTEFCHVALVGVVALQGSRLPCYTGTPILCGHLNYKSPIS